MLLSSRKTLVALLMFALANTICAIPVPSPGSNAVGGNGAKPPPVGGPRNRNKCQNQNKTLQIRTGNGVSPNASQHAKFVIGNHEGKRQTRFTCSNGAMVFVVDRYDGKTPDAPGAVIHQKEKKFAQKEIEDMKKARRFLAEGYDQVNKMWSLVIQAGA